MFQSQYIKLESIVHEFSRYRCQHQQQMTKHLHHLSSVNVDHFSILISLIEKFIQHKRVSGHMVNPANKKAHLSAGFDITL